MDIQNLIHKIEKMLNMLKAMIIFFKLYIDVDIYCCGWKLLGLVHIFACAYKLKRTVVLSGHFFLLKHTLQIVQPDITGCYPIFISPRHDILLYDLFPLRNPFTVVLCDKITLMMEFTLSCLGGTSKPFTEENMCCILVTFVSF